MVKRIWLWVTVLAVVAGCGPVQPVPAPSRWRCRMWEGMYDLEITSGRSLRRLWADGKLGVFGGRVEPGLTRLYTSGVPEGRAYIFEFSEDGQALDISLATPGDSDNMNIVGEWQRIPMAAGSR